MVAPALATVRLAPHWPSASEYMAALQSPLGAFAHPLLRKGTAVRDRRGMPRVASGNFAYVFRVRLPDGRERAVKCFRHFLGDRERRYVAIDSYLGTERLLAIANFEYLSDGIRIGGATYPILVMEWIEGRTLDVHVEAALHEATSAGRVLRAVAEEWCRIVRDLEDRGVSHGDLQHGNVIVGTGGLRLVDLDGMHVPGLAGVQAAESGHAHFQHPDRRAVARCAAARDRFPGLVIYLSLVAVAENPDLWDRYHDDNLIFDRRDFEQPDRSPLFAELLRAGGPIGALAATLKQACTLPPTQTPRLADLVPVKVTRLPAWMRSAELVVGGAPVATLRRSVTPPGTPVVATPPITTTSTSGSAPLGGASSAIVRAPGWVVEGFVMGAVLLMLGLITMPKWIGLFERLVTAFGLPKAQWPFWVVVLPTATCFGLGLLASSSINRLRPPGYCCRGWLAPGGSP